MNGEIGLGTCFFASLHGYTFRFISSMSQPAVRFYIVRHGETDENRQRIIQGQLDTDLNAAGLEQAQLTAKALENVLFSAAYTSDLSRAQKASIQAAVKFKKTLKVIQRLRKLYWLSRRMHLL